MREEFRSLELELPDFTAVLDELTKNTYIMVIVHDPTIGRIYILSLNTKSNLGRQNQLPSESTFDSLVKSLKSCRLIRWSSTAFSCVAMITQLHRFTHFLGEIQFVIFIIHSVEYRLSFTTSPARKEKCKRASFSQKNEVQQFLPFSPSDSSIQALSFLR